jgi:hypothetical protein
MVAFVFQPEEELDPDDVSDGKEQTSILGSLGKNRKWSCFQDCSSCRVCATVEFHQCHVWSVLLFVICSFQIRVIEWQFFPDQCDQMAVLSRSV